MPTTQVSVERLFSQLKLLRRENRAKIGSDLTEAILFIRANKLVAVFAARRAELPRGEGKQEAKTKSRVTIRPPGVTGHLPKQLPLWRWYAVLRHGPGKMALDRFAMISGSSDSKTQLFV